MAEQASIFGQSLSGPLLRNQGREENRGGKKTGEGDLRHSFSFTSFSLSAFHNIAVDYALSVQLLLRPLLCGYVTLIYLVRIYHPFS